MKMLRSGLLFALPFVGLTVLLVFSGCEGTTDEDSSGVSAYLAAHPYTSASRDTPLSPALVISPLQATAGIIGQQIAFSVSGGEGSYHWGVSSEANGRIESQEVNSAIYTCRLVGNNDVIVQDDAGHYATAHISPVIDTMTITPSSVTLTGGARYVSLAVSGGTAPYSWTSGNTALGVVSYSESSSYVAAYTAVSGTYGQNVITVIDAEGRTASSTIVQEP